MEDKCCQVNHKLLQTPKTKDITCFYISLHERRPDTQRKRRELPIDYYAETKKLPADITTYILFNSRSFEKSNPERLDNWTNVIGKLDDLLKCANIMIGGAGEI